MTRQSSALLGALLVALFTDCGNPDQGRGRAAPTPCEAREAGAEGGVVNCISGGSQLDAGGDASQDAGSAGNCNVYHSCDQAFLCTEYNANVTQNEIRNLCGASGSYAQQGCAPDQAVGRCELAQGNRCQNEYYFPPLFNADTARARCDQASGKFVALTGG